MLKISTISQPIKALATILLLAPASVMAACNPPVTTDMQQVGSTRLSVLFWDLYDAELLTDSGSYDNYEQRALRLTYLRDIESAELVESTREEWQRLNIEITEQHEQWLDRLNSIWPDITEGDCLLLVENNAGHGVFYNGQGKLGSIENQTFTDQFFAIWLDKDSRFKDERDELLGVNQ
ncbi:chalcone isomerase family protein [Pseudidiomarina salinarum]|uniref:chalcone isomerase family protein n=1 Tax=Pseudidiomarina salinarum TaxID=435908 RepID=UPI00068CF7C4|nr:chalcone isomerase family protein [Pseudidiomarina salinarum]RUO70246.1 hypothetical protein CWI79_01905 [Pseudidiomarina salinarum]